MNRDLPVEEPPPAEPVQRRTDTVAAELYDELLNRYERVLLYAGRLQEQNRSQQLLLEERNQDRELEAARLRKLVEVERSYVQVLEEALGSLGILPGAGPEPAEHE